MKTLTLNSYAKLNLFLSVRNKRPDKFHSIETLFERISLSDRIVLQLRSDKKIVFRCNDLSLPEDDRNLAVKAAVLMSKTYGMRTGLTIRLLKRIPAGAGMGGGSGNAATVLLGLNKLWGLHLSRAQLGSLAAQIGSDVPFFVYNCRFALASGKGDRIKPLPEIGRRVLWHVIVVPNMHVSTPLIYKHWDKLSASKNSGTSRLTRPVSNAKLIILALRGKSLPGLGRALFNSLEEVTADMYPQVREVKQALISAGVKYTLMSGSGSAFFGIVPSRKEAVVFSRKLKKDNRLWRVFVASTV
ncbi:MAG: 4-(cytidine 5'-diphospho)-2-C-methyl-D-erythritol kinase [Candidatus Omnitrophota bacterium]